MGEPSLMTLGRSFICTNCDRVMNVPDELVLRTVLQRDLPCPGCGNAIDGWGAIVSSLQKSNDLMHAVTFVGGYQTTFLVKVRAGERLVLDLTKRDVPAGARVHRVLHTCQPGPPVIMSFSSQTIGSPRLGTTLVFDVVPMKIGEAEDIDSTVAFTVAWSPPSSGDPADDLLLSAFGAYGDHDLKRAVLDAHTALDLVLRDVIMPILVQAGLPSRERLGPLQRMAVGAALGTARGIASLPREVMDAAHNLTKARNGQAAHGPGLTSERDEVARLLAGALVSIMYYRAVKEGLTERPARQAP